MKTYSDLKGITFVFAGERATTGEPNARTGAMASITHSVVRQVRMSLQIRYSPQLSQWVAPASYVVIAWV